MDDEQTQDNLWAEIVNTALLGTERRPFAVPPWRDALTGLLLSSLNGDKEAALLSMASTVAIYNRVGRLPVRDNSPLPPACEPEERPYVSAVSTQHLSALMTSAYHNKVLAEWLRKVARMGRVVPPENLVPLMDLGANWAEIREDVSQVVGKRGSWLAAYNPKWKYAIGVDDSQPLDTAWELGDSDSRVRLLKDLRSREPAKALDLLKSTWGQEKADKRAALLSALSTGLSIDDEPFLESMLDDKSKQVRATAAGLLSSIPESRLLARMVGRLRNLLTYRRVTQRGFLGLTSSSKDVIEVTLPEDCDASMQRDGIEPKSPFSGTGDKAWWLSQMLKFVPPRYWSTTWAVSPQIILGAALRNNEWKAVLLSAWLQATTKHPDAVWAGAFLSIDNMPAGVPDASALASQLPREQLEAYVLARLQKEADVMNNLNRLKDMLWSIPSPWSLALSRAVMGAIRAHLKQLQRSNYNYSWQIHEMLTNTPLYMPTSFRGEAAAALNDLTPQLPEALRSRVDDFLATLDFRHDMLKELAQ
ncbi:MAG: DUF5691 domain-containing protein [Chloroflexota bacterium]|nr:DUF5691 domain-containing protein [Chloroflexota bacterium]MDQ5865481.1 DUF5691 domain-containing protein [Chloroflexota bacterium]